MTPAEGRRSILKAGILAAGAAMLPRAATAAVARASTDSALERLREDYRRRVAVLAAELAPAYQHALLVDNDAAWDEGARGLEAACRDAMCSTVDEARLVFALSPHWDIDDHWGSCDARDAAATCVACDVAAVMGAKWYLTGWGVESDGDEA